MTNQVETRAAHTPGPWTVDAKSLGMPAGTRYTAYELRGAPDVCDGASQSREVEANAHLIAAAPDLLEALERARIAQESLIERLEFSHMKCDTANDFDCYAEQYGDGTPDEHEALRDYRSDLAKTDAATRKARGEGGASEP